MPPTMSEDHRPGVCVVGRGQQPRLKGLGGSPLIYSASGPSGMDEGISCRTVSQQNQCTHVLRCAVGVFAVEGADSG